MFAVAAKEVGLFNFGETANLALEYLHVLGKRFHNYDFQEMVISEENISNVQTILRNGQTP